MNKIWKPIRWLIINGAMGYLLYLGLWGGSNAALNIALFVTWATIFLSVFYPAAIEKASIEDCQKLTRSVPAWLDLTFDLVVCCAFASQGRFITASFWLIQMLCLQYSFYRVAEKIKEAATKQS